MSEELLNSEIPTIKKVVAPVVISPIGAEAKPRASKINKDGFVKGQEINEKDYFKSISMGRLKSKK